MWRRAALPARLVAARTAPPLRPRTTRPAAARRPASRANGSKPAVPADAPPVHIRVVEFGEERAITARTGQTLMNVAVEQEIELECACGGELACSTCHVILEESYYKKLPPPSQEENDMLDLASGLTETSRLGCQIKLGPELEGMRVVIPEGAVDQRASK
jgi:ferredoxin